MSTSTLSAAPETREESEPQLTFRVKVHIVIYSGSKREDQDSKSVILIFYHTVIHERAGVIMKPASAG